MAIGSDEKREIVKHLIASIPCAVCQHSYETDDVHIIDHYDEIWVTAVECSHCGTKGLVFAMIKEEEPEIISDLMSQEWTRFREMPRIDADDLLDIHEFLKDFDGDFIGLFE
jgi:C4-type Zn-finger protein